MANSGLFGPLRSRDARRARQVVPAFDITPASRRRFGEAGPGLGLPGRKNIDSTLLLDKIPLPGLEIKSKKKSSAMAFRPA
ncbi:MAG: hypothetical protein A2350_08515 [Candidatus Raymondbacteria bacterium RifOxyB12_full_50_8]|uniref:Uncharacterized protein n=1 Tax=Candidatus Raymondbacteria bacterium RIFOXYD12_FULL_49_13 TaxID=1817890 RepID=A0A1F7FIS6_UNCRA|nr:MAG: hypothetical protein A2248_21510 [Candidatus Raymondbacteria bacterium RIFOXYA2_FULL_49_16]OGJ94690.1 MAG: hypothetical protein A2350_08515 [Candidatus Raymondbacteria bacterium RifOxyB12_full_50_8]OGK06362.1 MAG: hypothetical protein A2519_08835 [Candidatus Raymondbacteria bacterium RIFOXYD12_FULL_49_13]OGP40696.1 MAG: hypothetical protein A2324_03580 [Candidatus Raymondbacteria bacterium RIFOXYB2_FULL_49_35]